MRESDRSRAPLGGQRPTATEQWEALMAESARGPQAIFDQMGRELLRWREQEMRGEALGRDALGVWFGLGQEMLRIGWQMAASAMTPPWLLVASPRPDVATTPTAAAPPTNRLH